MKIFTDKSIIEQSQCTISDNKTKTEGISITVLADRDIDAVEVVFTKDELEAALNECSDGDGHDCLWCWFNLSYASFLTLPRVLMHEMPDRWQYQMAKLLREYDAAFPNQPGIGTRVQCTKDGKLAKFPEWMLNYRHPDRAAIDEVKRKDR